MADRESIETHLRIIHTWASCALERNINFFEPAHFRDICHWIDDAIELLKEQEAVEPYQLEDIWKCGRCGGIVAYEELGVSGIENIRFNYCPTCGRRVKWE